MSHPDTPGPPRRTTVAPRPVSSADAPFWSRSYATSSATRTAHSPPILADALQDAGCDNEYILDRCRDPKQVHVRGCWVVDLVLGKE
jgi:hypothetical protein